VKPQYLSKMLICCILLLTHLALFGQSSTKINTTPDPWTKEEFPQWAHDVRRAEIVAFGSLPFTFFISTLVMDSVRYANNNWDSRYAPWPLKGAGAIDMTEDEKVQTFLFGCIGAIGVSLIDQIIIQVKRNQVKKIEESRKRSTIMIEFETPLPAMPPPDAPLPVPEQNAPQPEAESSERDEDNTAIVEADSETN
jgi:hypothetical protein